MDAHVRDVLRRLVAMEPLDVPAGEPGIVVRREDGTVHACIPVLSAYLDMRPQATGERPAVRAARIILRDRLREVQKTFWPRGVAFDSVREDAARIERYLDEQAPVAAQGVAIFASARHGLFETIATAVPFETRVSARAEPDLFQLARLLDDRETAVVAVVDSNTARLFVSRLGGLREVRGLDDDPKYYHKVRGANAMNQARYQRHADNVRTSFAREVAARIEELVDREGAAHVILSGDAVAIPLLRKALAPRVAALVHEPPLSLDVTAPRDAVSEATLPLIEAAEAEQDRTIVERLVDAVRADALGVAELEPTRRALQNGQVDTLVLAGDVPFPPETRSELIDLAAKTGAAVEVVDGSEVLRELGGVGALLRYRTHEPAEFGLLADAGEGPAHP